MDVFTPKVILCAIAIAIFVFAYWIVDSRRQAEFNLRFPPISDDEFLARCAPGTNREVALKVRKIVAEQLDVDYDRVYPSSSFVNDLGVN